MPGQHQFASRAQARWAYSTHQKFAKRWGEATEVGRGFKSLPARKRPPSAGRALKAFGSR